MKRAVPYRETLLEALRDPEEARLYLDVAVEEYESDGDAEALLLALHTVAEAQGGAGERALADGDSLRLDAISRALHALGFRLAVARAEPEVA